MDYALDVLGRIRADMEGWFTQQSEALQAGRCKGEDVGQPDPVRRLVGQMRHLWNHSMELQKRVEAVEGEKKELVDWQTKAMDKALAMNSRVTELEQERAQLRRQLEDAQVEPPAAVTPPASASIDDAVRSYKAMADQLERDCHRNRGAQKQLQEQVKQLQALNKRQTGELARDNFTIDVCRDRITSLQQASQSTSSTLPSPTALSGVQPSIYQERSGQARLPTTSGSFPSSMATPDNLSAPPMLTPIRGSAPGPSDTGTLTLPRLTPKPSTSRAAPTPARLGRGNGL